MNALLRLSWIATGFAIVGALLGPYTSHPAVFWVFAACIVISCALVLYGVLRADHEWREVQEAVDLQDRWRRQRERTR